MFVYLDKDIDGDDGDTPNWYRGTAVDGPACWKKYEEGQ